MPGAQPLLRTAAAINKPQLPLRLTQPHTHLTPLRGFSAGWRFAYPAYNPKSPLDQGPLKLPVLAASKSLRRSRKAGAARMDAG
ncbi:putative transcriptional regulator (LysR family) [Klebsiella variicola]|nr:putative transcriptional regulator (LysR family) [Klebsiella variicola]